MIGRIPQLYWNVSGVWAFSLYALIVGAFLATFAWRYKKDQESSSENPAPSRLKIHSALYGTGPVTDMDVGAILQQQNRDALAVFISNDLFGRDPAPNIPKRLEVEYSYGNQHHLKVMRPEGYRLVLPEDSYVTEVIQRRTEQINNAGDPSLELEYIPDIGFRLSNPSDMDAVNIAIPRHIEGPFCIEWDSPNTLSRKSSQTVGLSIRDSTSGIILSQDPKQIIEKGWSGQINTTGNKHGKELMIPTLIKYETRSGLKFRSHWEIKYELSTTKISTQFIKDESVR